MPLHCSHKKWPHQFVAHLAPTLSCVCKNSLAMAGVVTAIAGTKPSLSEKISPYYFSYDYSGVTFAAYTPVWRHLRKIRVAELFSQRRMRAFQGVREVEMRYMIRSGTICVELRRLSITFRCSDTSTCSSGI